MGSTDRSINRDRHIGVDAYGPAFQGAPGDDLHTPVPANTIKGISEGRHCYTPKWLQLLAPIAVPAATAAVCTYLATTLAPAHEEAD